LLSTYAESMKPALIRDPRVVPVTGIDSHLPAIAPERLTLAAVRQRVLSPPPWEPEFGGDGHRFNERPPAAASVLIALVDRPDGLHVLLTRRTDHLRDHAGQISFAGGRREDSDADAIATALREAEEEIGLAARHVQVLAELPSYTTVTAFVVTPVVALVHPPFDITLDAFEVAEAFEVPLAFLMNPANHRRHALEAGDVKRQFLSMPWHGRGCDGVQREYYIWGATAAMLRNVYRLLAA
jgi:8-oxo-dGTP pyrophosphatase MutT (NUDIX family)